MKSYFLPLALLLSAGMVGPVRAQEPTLALAGTETHLGMSEADFRASASPHFRITDVTAGRPNKVLLVEETSAWKEGQPVEKGNVTFGPAGLVRAVKSWPKNPSVAADLAMFDAMSRALSEAGALAGNEVRVTFSVVQREPVHVERLKFSLGPKAVVLERQTVKGHTWVSVLEVLEAAPETGAGSASQGGR